MDKTAKAKTDNKVGKDNKVRAGKGAIKVAKAVSKVAPARKGKTGKADSRAKVKTVKVRDKDRDKAKDQGKAKVARKNPKFG